MKFLIVDDEPLVRRSLIRAIQLRGHEAAEAADGSEGLTLWKRDLPDIVIADVLMPGVSGPDMVKQVLASWRPELRRPTILLISAFSGEDSEKLARDCGADGFIAKPFDDIFAVVDVSLSLALRKG